jgi:hypothetical protein
LAYIETAHRGLIVCEEAADETSVQRQLRDFDDRLILSKEVDQEHGCYVYVVVRRWSNERDAAIICEWRDETGRPLPLSSRLVDKAKNLHVGSRAPQADPVAFNDAVKEANRKEADDVFDSLLHDALRRNGRLPIFHRSMGLARTRARLRDQGLDR